MKELRTVQNPDHPTKINWEMVFEENKDSEAKEFLRRLFNFTLMAWQNDELGPSLEEHQGIIYICHLIAEVITESLMAAKIPLSTEVFITPLFDIPQNIVASVATKDKNSCVISLNGNLMVEAAKEFEQMKAGKPSSGNIARLIFFVAHEIGHVRQQIVLGEMGEDVPKFSALASNEQTDDFIDNILRYFTHPIETNAYAFATRYIQAKKQDEGASAIWVFLDFSEILTSVWTTITDSIKHKLKLLANGIKHEFKTSNNKLSPSQINRLQSELEIIEKKLLTTQMRKSKMRKLFLGENH